MTESRDRTYQGRHGRLAARTWTGTDAPSHVVPLAHGYGEHIGRYERLADALVGTGAVVYAVDHVGHGNSEGERVLVEDFEDVVADLHQLDETARREHPGRPVVLLGHSMGGLIGARYAQRYGDTLAPVQRAQRRRRHRRGHRVRPHPPGEPLNACRAAGVGA